MTLSVAFQHRFSGFTLDVAFEAPAGVTALFGRSGSGKTSVVNVVAGLLRPDTGRVLVGDNVLQDSTEGRWLPPHKRRLGYVFQDARLFPHLTVQQNLTYGARFAAGTQGPDFDQVVDLLGLGSLLSRAPGDLSGGEKARVGIGRALLSRPRMLLMDEPLASLDPARKEEILPYLERLRDEVTLPILYVSHAVPEVARLATSVVLLDNGRVARIGPAAEVLADPQAASVLGIREAGAILTATVAGHHLDGLTELSFSGGVLFLPQISAAPGTSLRIRIPARDVMISLDRPEAISALNVLPAKVESVRLGEGPGSLVQLSIGQDTILARITQRSAKMLSLRPGLACHAVIKTLAVAQADVGRS